MFLRDPSFDSVLFDLGLFKRVFRSQGGCNEPLHPVCFRLRLPNNEMTEGLRHPVDAARLSGQLFSEVRAAERPCAKYQQ